MRSKQANESQKLNLIQEIVTRWNYTYLMMERIIKISQHVNAVLRDSKNNLKDLILTDNDLKDLADLIDALFCFHDATVRLSAEKNVTISYVIPNVNPKDSDLKKNLNQLY